MEMTLIADCAELRKECLSTYGVLLKTEGISRHGRQPCS